MENLQVKLRLLKAKLKAQRNFSMNTSMYVAATITEAEIKELELIITERDSPKLTTGESNCTLCGVMPSAFVAKLEDKEYIVIENKMVTQEILDSLYEKYDMPMMGNPLHKFKIAH